MAIYSKVGDRIRDIRIDRECYVGNELIQIWGIPEGATLPRLLYISDLRADEGKTEINSVIKAILKAQSSSGPA